MKLEKTKEQLTYYLFEEYDLDETIILKIGAKEDLIPQEEDCIGFISWFVVAGENTLNRANHIISEGNEIDSGTFIITKGMLKSDEIYVSEFLEDIINIYIPSNLDVKEYLTKKDVIKEKVTLLRDIEDNSVDAVINSWRKPIGLPMG